MIVGMVRGREPLIRLMVHGFRGRRQEIEAVIDTGYTGWLTLPPSVIGALKLPWRTVGRGTLADGSVSLFDVYQAKVLWDGRVRAVFVDEFDATPNVLFEGQRVKNAGASAGQGHDQTVAPQVGPGDRTRTRAPNRTGDHMHRRGAGHRHHL